MSDDRREDPDRAAILARRQHFIALALSGLATTACAHGRKPQVCLRVPADETEARELDFDDEDNVDGETLRPESCTYPHLPPPPRTQMQLDTRMDDELSAVPAGDAPPQEPE